MEEKELKTDHVRERKKCRKKKRKEKQTIEEEEEKWRPVRVGEQDSTVRFSSCYATADWFSFFFLPSPTPPPSFFFLSLTLSAVLRLLG